MVKALSVRVRPPRLKNHGSERNWSIAGAKPPIVDVRPFGGFETKPSISPLPRSKGEVSSTLGRHGGAVSAVMLGTLGFSAMVGVPTTAFAQDVTPPNKDADLDRIADAVADLELNKGTMSPAELEAARAKLWSAYVRAGGNANDASRVLGERPDGTITANKTRGELRIERLVKDIEREMRVTARDMAHHENVDFVDGTYAYKELSESRVKDMIIDALKDIPLSEFPGGTSLAHIIEGLPNAGHLDAAKMSFNEISDELGDAQSEWLKEKFGPFFAKHKIEAAVVAFGTVTAVRYTSPETAEMMNGFIPGIEVYDESFFDGSLETNAELKYRERNVLPDVDLKARLRRNLGNDVHVRADANARLSLESEEHVSGNLSAGLRKIDGNSWYDVSGYVNHEGKYGTTLEAGHRNEPAGLFLRGRVGADFGDNVAHGDANGRVRWELDMNKDLRVNGLDGSVGVFVGGGVDTNGRNDDVRAGLVFTLRW